MPFEALACTNCGSGNVQEVKPNTYFCHHCDSVFKHVDPTKLSVGPAFCEHGNRVEVQCQVCKAGMCRSRCDLVLDWFRNGHGGIVRTEGFGYLNAGRDREVSVDGPFLSVGKLLTSLGLDRGEALEHACYSCVIGAVPAAAVHIATGAMCEALQCLAPAAVTCPCCRGGFCRECSMPKVEAHWLRNTGGRLGKTAAVCAWDPEYDRANESFPLDQPMPEGLCGLCVCERREKIAAVASGICRQDYAGKLVPLGAGGVFIGGGGNSYFEDRFKVPATPTRVRSKNYPVESTRVIGVARRYAAEINARLPQLVVTDGNCDRGRLPASRFTPRLGYAIADERDRVRPAAVSGVIW